MERHSAENLTNIIASCMVGGNAELQKRAAEALAKKMSQEERKVNNPREQQGGKP
jgi:hypothetical protein